MPSIKKLVKHKKSKFFNRTKKPAKTPEILEHKEEIPAAEVVINQGNVVAPVDPAVPSDQPPGRKYYFNNPLVESLLAKYVDGACVDITLRDEIMSHASELIRQIIRAHNFEHIYPGRDASTFNDLYQVAYLQLEKTLYKYNSAPGSPKVFNLWSQISKTRILAYLKKEKRDKKNVGNYKDYLVRRYKTKSKSAEDFDKWLIEAERVCEDNQDFIQIVRAIKHMRSNDEKPHDGFITKLEKLTNLHRHTIIMFIKTMRLRMDEFSVDVAQIKHYRDHDIAADPSYFFTDQDN